MLAGSRAERVGDAMSKELAVIFSKDINDPCIKDIVTITGVKLSRDLRMANVYYSVLFDDDKIFLKVKEGLNRARGFIKKELAQRLSLRYMPDVRFLFDPSFSIGARIEKLFSKLDITDDDNNIS